LPAPAPEIESSLTDIIALKSRKKELSALWGSAMNALSRREHSVFEMRRKLQTRAEADLLDELINALLADDLISDERFAYMLCRSRFNKGVGPVRIEHELNQHCIRPEWIEQAMEEYTPHWIDLVYSLNKRKYGDKPPVDYKAWAKRARFFQGRGFSTDQIHRAIPRNQ
jgi:regulatory protein